MRIRAWADGQPEPATWNFTATDATAALQTAGGADLRAYLSTRSTNAPVTVRFDDFKVADLLAPPPTPTRDDIIANSDTYLVADGSATSTPTGSASPTPTATSTSIASPTASASGDGIPDTSATAAANATLVGAADVAACNSQGDEKTAALINAIPGTVFVAGDLAYSGSAATDIANCYAPSWGQFKDRTDPAIGNHEYETPGAAPYWDVLGCRGRRTGQGLVCL